MTALAITITPAGLAAAVNAANTGTGPLQITEIGLMSAPSTQIKRIATFAGESIADNIIHVTITDETADTYTLTGIRLYTDTGILFATYDQAGAILEKGAQSIALISADILLTSVPAGSVTIGGTGFIYPGATTARQGVIEIATDAEVQTGTDTTRAVTPAGIQAATATAAPVMNGAASAGTSKRISRSDHVHPVDTSRQAALGYTPVQQGTGVGQTGNAIKIGWSAGAKLKGTVDNGDLGNFAFEAWVSALFTALRDGSPDVLSTLGKISASIGNDPNFATTITSLIAGKASKLGDTFSGPIAIASGTEAQVHVARAGFDTAYLFSNGSQWGLYSPSGGLLVGYNRANGKSYFAGIDSTEIVRNNGGTYNINITGSAAWSNLTGRPAGADRNTNYQYHAGSPQWLIGTNDADPNNDYLYSPGELSVGYAANAGAVTDLSSIPGSSGSRSIPGGDKEKWGVLYLGDILSGVQTYSVTFPVSFGSACDNLQLTIEDSTANSSALDIKIRSRSASGFTLQIFESSGFVQNLSIHWTAKGR